MQKKHVQRLVVIALAVDTLHFTLASRVVNDSAGISNRCRSGSTDCQIFSAVAYGVFGESKSHLIPFAKGGWGGIYMVFLASQRAVPASQQNPKITVTVALFSFSKAI